MWWVERPGRGGRAERCRARYSVFLEQTHFEHRTADFAWMLVFGMGVLVVRPPSVRCRNSPPATIAPQPSMVLSAGAGCGQLCLQAGGLLIPPMRMAVYR